MITNIEEVFIELPKLERHNNNALVACGDSLSLLSLIKSKTIDLIFIDPPYNIGKDFGNNKDSWNSTSDYISWCKKWIDECFRVLKDDGTFYFMTATQFISYLDVYVQENYNVVSRIVWTYDRSGAQSKKCYGSLWEPILMTTKSKNSKYTFNKDDILVDAPTGSKRKLIDYRKNSIFSFSKKNSLLV